MLTQCQVQVKSQIGNSTLDYLKKFEKIFLSLCELLNCISSQTIKDTIYNLGSLLIEDSQTFANEVQTECNMNFRPRGTMAENSLYLKCFYHGLANSMFSSEVASSHHLKVKYFQFTTG